MSEKPQPKIDYEALRAAFKTDKGQISEARIARYVIEELNLMSRHGVPYNTDGVVDRAMIVQAIADLLLNLGVEYGNAHKAEAIMKLIIQLSADDEIPIKKNRIPVANGEITVNLENGSYVFTPKKEFTPYRLACSFDPNANDITWFKRWLGILYDDDIACFQEIMGYLLLPVTYGQYAFFLVGEGGCGKSVWGCILRAIFGNSMTSAETHAIETDRFARATLENKLLNYDDDLDGAKMKKTNVFKMLVTAKQPIQCERKGVDRFEFTPFARLCGCGNSSLSSMFDMTDAFVRRLLLIKAKPPIEKSKVIPDLEERIYPETSAILNWALEGMKRLIKNNYQFSISERSKALVQNVREESNSIIPFINDSLDFHPAYYVGSEMLIYEYRRFCRDNDLVPRDSKLVRGYFNDHAEQLGITYVNKVPVTRKRGFRGMKLKSDETQKIPTVDLNEIFGEK